MFKIGDWVYTKAHNKKPVCYAGTIIDISGTTALIKYDDWGNFWTSKKIIFRIIILCA